LSTQLTSGGASDVRQLIAQTIPVLDAFQRDHPRIALDMTGFLSLVGTGSNHMITDLGKSLIAAVLIIFSLNVLLFRSLRFGLISLIPNIAPIAAVAAILVWSGEPLRYSSVVLFSICLGLAIDDTVHYLVRFRQHRQSGESTEQATQLTSAEVGEVLILTTLVMCAGFGSLLVSTTPAIVSMGGLACVALLVALLSDILLLPALLRKFYL
jgi:predicted RND superfamily exporter protein